MKQRVTLGDAYSLGDNGHLESGNHVIEYSKFQSARPPLKTSLDSYVVES